VDDKVTDKFVGGLYELTLQALPDSVVHQGRLCLLHYLGVTLAGARILSEKGGRLLRSLGSMTDGVRVIGFEKKASIQTAALVNGLSAHVAELDDGVRFGGIHPGAPILSALLPLAERESLSARRLLLGIVVGYEAAVRMARAVQPSHKAKGYHATGTCGALGAAAGAATILGLDRSQMKHAFSCAATAAAGILRATADESELKPFNAGQAAVHGLVAALMAQAGFAGPADVLGGDGGWLGLMADEHDISQLERREGESFGIEQVYFKPYAACRHCHSAIEAALQIRSAHGIQPELIDTVSVTTYASGICGHDHRDIAGASSAKMSIPYSVAVALIRGRAGLDEFLPDQVGDPEVLALTRKVQVHADDALTALVPRKRPSIVEITTNDRHRYSARVDLPRGEPENPLSEREIKQQCIALSMFGGASPEKAEALVECVMCLDDGLEGLWRILYE